MIRLLTTLILLCICGLGATTLFAQSGTVTSGGDIVDIGGSVSFTIGQYDYNYTSNGSESISEGLQQPIEIQVISGFEDNDIRLLSMTVYPNPVTDFLNLKVEGDRLRDLSYSIFNMQGQILSSATISAKETTIRVSEYAIGTYLLIVTDKSGTVKTFKVIKNN